MRRGADVIVNIDGDGQFNPADIGKLIAPILDDNSDFVTCSRFADPALRPTMPIVKYYGNQWVTSMINWICGGTKFTDVSCGFRAFNREAAYRMTLFGRFTYTQECFIDLFSKGLRMAEVPLKVRGVREHGKSRIASSIFKYATNSFPIILRAMRDIQPLKFFGGIAALFGALGVLCGGFVFFWYLFHTRYVNGFPVHQTSPFTSLIPIAGALMTLAFVLGVLALLADMLGRHRRISEEMLYLARRRVYSSKRTVRVSLPPVPEESKQGLSLHAEAHPEAGGYFRSDHFNFAKAGVPAMDIGSGDDLVNGGTAAGEAAGKDYNEHRYHKPGDQYDAATWKVDGVVELLDAAYGVGRELTSGTQWPQWYPGNPFKAARDLMMSPKIAPAKAPAPATP